MLGILDRSSSITGSTRIVLSYLLSMFTTFIVGFLILLSRNTISSLGAPAIIIVTLFFVLVYHISYRKRVESPLTIDLDLLKTIFILSVLLAIGGASTIIMINNLPLTSGDMLRHHGFALQFLKHFPVYGGKLTDYPAYLFNIYLAMLFTLSGIPSPLTEQGLYVLNFIPLLAFYSLIKDWFSEEDSRFPLIVVMLSTLLGFGGLYALYLKLIDVTYQDITQLLAITTSKTYDIYMRVLYLPDIVAPSWSIGLPTFFMLLLFTKKVVPRLIKAATIPILFALGYLGHISEMIIFLLVTLAYKLFFFWRDNSEKIGSYVLIGLSIIALLDLVAPVSHYVFLSFTRPNIGKVLSYFVSVILTSLICIIEFLRDKRMFLSLIHI